MLPQIGHQLIEQWCDDKEDMPVDPTVLNVDGDPVFPKQRMLSHGQRKGAAKEINKMEDEGIFPLLFRQPGPFRLWWQ